jgi:hypothetical protein
MVILLQMLDVCDSLFQLMRSSAFLSFLFLGVAEKGRDARDMSFIRSFIRSPDFGR